MDTSTAPRRLHLIDVENLVGHGRPDLHDLHACCDAYRSLGLLTDHDLVVIGCNPGPLFEVSACWGTARCVTRHGPSGADLALLDVLIHERIDQRFTEIVLASGDGIFTEVIADLQRLGVAVTVVAPATSLSRRLRLAASRVVEFHRPNVLTPPVALVAKAVA